MLTFRSLTPEDHDLVLPMVQDFYLSDAVDHPVDADILERSFRRPRRAPSPGPAGPVGGPARRVYIRHPVLRRRGGGPVHLY